MKDITALLKKLPELQKINFHYLRKENQLFPLLEKKGVSGPSSVMWGIHDDIRKQFKSVRALLTDSPGLQNIETELGVIGRKVQNCHPGKSLHRVGSILEAFRSGKKDAADFWITLNGRFILIRYFAVRDEEGNYKGTLEVTQDITEVRQLQGENRLLDWE